MTPTLVHRYAFATREAIEALLGDAVGDCMGWRIRVEGDEVVVDVISPVPGIAPTVADVTSLASNEGAKSNAAANEVTDQHLGETSVDPELKGGPLARRAAMACGDRVFRTFLQVETADEAKAFVCQRCGVTTRKMLDHDERAGAIWTDIDRKFALWKEGYDVEI